MRKNKIKQQSLGEKNKADNKVLRTNKDSSSLKSACNKSLAPIQQNVNNIKTFHKT